MVKTACNNKSLWNEEDILPDSFVCRTENNPWPITTGQYLTKYSCDSLAEGSGILTAKLTAGGAIFYDRSTV